MNGGPAGPPRPDRHGPQQGAATSELVVAVPALLTLLLLIVQAGVWLHAGHVVQAAAQEGAAAARLEQGSAQAGQARAVELLDSLGARLLTDRRVTAARTAETARVEVTGHAVAVLPGLRLPLRAVAERPVERFRPAPPPAPRSAAAGRKAGP